MDFEITINGLASDGIVDDIINGKSREGEDTIQRSVDDHVLAAWAGLRLQGDALEAQGTVGHIHILVRCRKKSPCGGTADATDLKSVDQKRSCGFDSHQGHLSEVETGHHPKQSTPCRRGPAWILGKITALLILAGIVWYVTANFGVWKDRFVPRKFRVIDPGMIYASGQINHHLIRRILIDNKIRRIICLDADDLNDPDVAEEIRAANDLGIERFVDPLSGDGTGDIHSYVDAISQMVEAAKKSKPTLLHCSSGAQRSNGATFYYRVFIEKWNADDAAAEMLRNGHDPKFNPLLIPYLNSHMAEMAALLVQRGVIEKAPDPLPVIHQ